MRFSIRSLLILVFIAAAVVAYYMSRQPLRIPIVAHTISDEFYGEEQRPELVIRSYDQEKIRQAIASWDDEYRRDCFPTPKDKDVADASYHLLKQDLNSFGERRCDRRTVKENKEEFKKIATERMSDSHPFHDVDVAFYVLWEIDEYQIAIDKLTGRFLKQLPNDPPILLWPFRDILQASEEREKYLGTKSEFIAEIHRIEKSSPPVVDGKMWRLPYEWLRFTGRAGAEARLKQLRTYIASDTSLDDELSTRIEAADDMLCLAKDWKLNIGDRERNAALKLCKEKLATKADREASSSYDSDRINLIERLHAYLKAVEPKSLPELKEILLKACSQEKPPPNALKALTEMSDLSDAAVFREILSRSRSYRDIHLLIGSPKRLGIRKDAEERLTKLVESGKLREYPRPYGIPDPVEEYARIHGEAAIPFFKSQIDEKKCLSSIERLAELRKGTKDAETIAYLRNAFEEVRRQSEDGDEETNAFTTEDGFSTAEWIIDALTTIGDEQVDELWQQMPPPARPDQAMQIHWKSNPDLRRDDLIQYLNQNLRPKQKFTAENFGHASYGSVISAFDSAGLVYYDDGDVSGGMGENVHRLVKDHVNLQAFSDGPSQHSSHIVIDNWLYEVQLDHWMNTADMVDIFNAIMAERGETRRFFLFKEIGLFHYHAVFVEPQIVRDLRDKFGMKPVEGYEYYLEH